MNLLSLLLPLALSLGLASSVPMVENSVKFALERCKQFLHLATFLKDDALGDDEISRTKRVCDHIVVIEEDLEGNGGGERFKVLEGKKKETKKKRQKKKKGKGKHKR